MSKQAMKRGVCVCAGRTAGSSRPAGAEEDRAAASGWIRLAAYRHGFFQDERGKVTQISSSCAEGKIFLIYGNTHQFPSVHFLLI